LHAGAVAQAAGLGEAVRNVAQPHLRISAEGRIHGGILSGLGALLHNSGRLAHFVHKALMDKDKKN
jgi:hypothetical protein